ncbi:MAG: glycosyltransferase family 2 protein [Bacteroidota bacterium]
MKSLSILIPAFNEARTIERILDRVLEVELTKRIQKEIIVIDDCSTDDTTEIVSQYIVNHQDCTIYLKKHPKNKGKGAAIRTGIAAATGDYLIVQDADLEYDPAEFNELLQPVFYDNADVVYGSRFMGSKPHRILFFWHTIGNKFLTFLSNMLTNLNLTDMETCYKLFRSDIIKKIDLKENRFGFEPEVTAKIARIPEIKIYEVGISYYGRTYAEGKKINWRDGFRAIYCILRYNLFR